MSAEWPRAQTEVGANGSRRRSGRFEVLDSRPVNLDGLSVEDPEVGLAALHSPFDPEPSIVVNSKGRVVELDSAREAEFDMIDSYIAKHGIDVAAAEAAMLIPDVEFAGMIVDPNVPRQRVVDLALGMTPAKLARVAGGMRPVELMMGVAKMRVRRTPSSQAHVTNRYDDPILLAADAATAVAFGFRELETTVPVLDDAASNAMAVLIGSQVYAPGALVQCSIEEARELRLGMRGLTTYAETVSVYGTDTVFRDGDDTPWSKALLCSMYASRGLKMRVTSGGGAEVLMGAADRKSMLYLEARCVWLARAMGAQGVQNGGIDGVAVVASVPDGMRSLLAENLLVMLLDLESCSGHDSQVSESEIRRSAHTVPLLLVGSDFLFSGFGSVAKHDNMFAPSNFNAEDIDDYLILQRDWGVDGALRTVDEETLLLVRRRAAEAAQAVYRDLDLAEYSDDYVDQVVHAYSSRDLRDIDPMAATLAARAIDERGLTALDMVDSLARCGFTVEAERVLGMLRQRLQGDYLQTAAIFDEEMNVLSKATDPNDYQGPGTGYDMSPGRRGEIAGVRQERSLADLLGMQREHDAHARLTVTGRSEPGSEPNEVCIGLSPALGTRLWMTTSGLLVGDVLWEMLAGLEEEGCTGRLVRVPGTVDLGRIGLEAARLAGSGIGIGLQAKGTVLIHRRGLTPLENLELLAIAPYLTREMYRQIGHNAAKYAKGEVPVPIRIDNHDEAFEARYHAETCAMVAVEQQEVDRCAPPVDLRLDR